GPNSRCSPATPTSNAVETRQPISRATATASSATGTSDVPAVTTPTRPPAAVLRDVRRRERRAQRLPLLGPRARDQRPPAPLEERADHRDEVLDRLGVRQHDLRHPFARLPLQLRPAVPGRRRRGAERRGEQI